MATMMKSICDGGDGNDVAEGCYQQRTDWVLSCSVAGEGRHNEMITQFHERRPPRQVGKRSERHTYRQIDTHRDRRIDERTERDTDVSTVKGLRERETERDRQRERERKRDRQTGRQRQRQRETETERDRTWETDR